MNLESTNAEAGPPSPFRCDQAGHIYYFETQEHTLSPRSISDACNENFADRPLVVEIRNIISNKGQRFLSVADFQAFAADLKSIQTRFTHNAFNLQRVIKLFEALVEFQPALHDRYRKLGLPAQAIRTGKCYAIHYGRPGKFGFAVPRVICGEIKRLEKGKPPIAYMHYDKVKGERSHCYTCFVPLKLLAADAAAAWRKKCKLLQQQAILCRAAAVHADELSTKAAHKIGDIQLAVARSKLIRKV